MNKTNVLYPHSLIWLRNKFRDFCLSYCKTKELFYSILFFSLLFLFSPLLLWWYVLDVVSNILDKVCMLYFVNLPLWAYEKMEEYEKTYGKYGVKP